MRYEFDSIFHEETFISEEGCKKKSLDEECGSKKKSELDEGCCGKKKNLNEGCGSKKKSELEEGCEGKKKLKESAGLLEYIDMI